jgi:hypothetical protein
MESEGERRELPVCGHARDQDRSGPVSVRQSKLRGQNLFYGALFRWPPLPNTNSARSG